MPEWPDWSGETCVVVASGPSAKDVPLELARGKARVLAVKDGWKLCPWADWLYGCDHHWWEAHRGVPEFPGPRMAYDARTIEKYRGMPFLRVNILKPHQNLLFERVGWVGWGGNSGFHAVNLAAQFGVAVLILVGFDMRVDQGKHFFGEHKYTRDRPSKDNVKRWADILDRQAATFERRGIRVVNCSPVSTLKAYPKMSLEEALALQPAREQEAA